MQNQLDHFREDYGEDWFEQVYKMYKGRTDWFNYTDIESNMIINGWVLYYRVWTDSTKITYSGAGRRNWVRFF